MKFAFHDYDLVFKGSKKMRSGFLVKAIFDDGCIGFADCHPWEEFGDLPVNRQKDSFLKEQWNPLSRRSLNFARLDAEARAVNKPLLEGRNIPESHYLIADLLQAHAEISIILAHGFSHIKIKLGNNLRKECEILKAIAQSLPSCKWRLDFNSKISEGEFLNFLEMMDQELSLIDFCEDPFTFNEKSWRAIEENYSISLAADFEANKIKGSYYPKVIVIKPAVQSKAQFPKGQRIVVTSYLDHPLGQLAAAYEAGQNFSNEVAGLISHTAYEETVFSRGLNKGPKLCPPKGTGWGFDNLLSEIDWR